MPNQHEQSDLSRLEAALKGLHPAPVDFKSDLIMYRAGQASRRRQVWALAAAGALAGLLFGIVGTYQILQRTLQPEQRIVYVKVPVPMPPAPPIFGPGDDKEPVPPQASPPSLAESRQFTWLENTFPTKLSGYLALREQMLRWGADQLPEPSSPTAPDTRRPPSSLLELNRELEGPREEIQLFPSLIPFFKR
jgi:hypothetical protein